MTMRGLGYHPKSPTFSCTVCTVLNASCVFQRQSPAHLNEFQEGGRDRREKVPWNAGKLENNERLRNGIDWFKQGFTLSVPLPVRRPGSVGLCRVPDSPAHCAKKMHKNACRHVFTAS
jgi:hypothetical protein